MGPMGTRTQYQDGFWTVDGLKLHYRDYPAAKSAPKGRPTILCIPGLTRNVRDFEPLVEEISEEWRVITVDLRGRGDSEWAKGSASYAPPVYASDVMSLLDDLKIRKVVTIGTSLGGLVSMLMAAMKPERVVGAVLNDIGPVLEKIGLDRIRGSVGKGQNWPTWVHAARAASEAQGHVYPDYQLEQWIAFAKRVNRLTAQGRIVPDYDARIADPIREQAGDPQPDLWPLFDALGDVPVLVLRGELSEVLSADTAKAMAKRLPQVKLRTVPGVGHAPALDEPAAQRAVQTFLKVLAG